MKRIQELFITPYFRVYTQNDIKGVEIGASVKNVIAIGCGICDGLGFGTNAKGALITRGIVEMQRLGKSMGAQAKTFWGLAGLGDLITTSFSLESRNHTLGVLIGQGKSLAQATSDMVMVIEGIPTARAIKHLSEEHHIDMPICDAVYKILFEKTSPRQALRDLMARPLKNE
jgi:glycerol-3-phosphate dehydrogenase (NAD(P)+)